MSCVADVHVSDTGTTFTVTITECGVALDISAATEMLLYFRAPSGGTYERAASFVTGGSDGRIKYVTDATLINEPGTWQLQARITTPAGVLYSEIETFVVASNLV